MPNQLLSCSKQLTKQSQVWFKLLPCSEFFAANVQSQIYVKVMHNLIAEQWNAMTEIGWASIEAGNK